MTTLGVRLDKAAAALCAEWVETHTDLPPMVKAQVQFDVITEDGREEWRKLVRVVDSALGETQERIQQLQIELEDARQIIAEIDALKPYPKVMFDAEYRERWDAVWVRARSMDRSVGRSVWCLDDVEAAASVLRLSQDMIKSLLDELADMPRGRMT